MTQRKIGKSGKKVLLTFTASYLLLLLIPIGMGIGTFSFLQKNLRTQMAQSGLESMSGAISTLEGQFEEIDRFALMLHSIQSVQNFMTVSTPLDANDVYKVREGIKELPNSILISPLIDWFMLYNPLCDVIAMPQTAYIHLEKYYQTTVSAEGMDYSQWHAQMLNNGMSSMVFPSRAYTFAQKRADCLVYRKNMAFPNNFNACALFYLSEQRLVQLFSPAFQDACLFQIYDRSGQRLLHYAAGALENETLDAASLAGAGSLTIAGQENSLYVLHAQSAALGWKFVYAIPGSTFSSQSARMLLPILLGTGAMIAVGVLLVLLLWAYNRRPLKYIVSSLPIAESASSYGLWRLLTAIQQLSTSHSQLLEKMRVQQVCLQSALIHQLINDSQEGDAAFQEILDNIQIPLRGQRFRGVYMRLDPAMEDAERAGLMDLIQAYSDQLVFLTFKGAHCLALLYCQKGPEDACARLLTALYQFLYTQMDAQVSFFVGSPVDSLRAVSQSFLGARQQMSVNAEENDTFLSMDEHCACSMATVYSAQDEQRLVNLAWAGQMADIVGFLEDMRRQLRENKALHHADTRCMLFHRMLYTLALIEKESNETPGIVYHVEELTPDEFISLLTARYAAICQKNVEQQQSSSQERAQQVLEYINLHYADPDLCLSQIALMYGMNENYLSAYIKKYAGINFSAYLEQLRIERADDLLLGQPDETIERIACLVGYANVKSFRRAYIRVKGLTPSAYRAQNTAKA